MKSYRILREGYFATSQKWKKIDHSLEAIFIYKFIKRTTRNHLFQIGMIPEEIKSSLEAQEYESLHPTDWKEFRRIKCCVVPRENIYYCLNTILIQVYRGIFKEVSVQDRKICSSLSEDKMPNIRVIREISRSLTEEGTDNSLYNCNMPTHPFFPSEKMSGDLPLFRNNLSKNLQ